MLKNEASKSRSSSINRNEQKNTAELISSSALAFGRVDLRAVHQLRDTAALHQFSEIWPQQRFQELRLESVGFQPPLIMLRAENHRHPVVDGSNHRVGFGGDDGKGFDDLTDGRASIVQAQLPLAMRTMPCFPEASHAEETAALHGEPERLFAGRRGLPFVKTIGGNQAALRLKRTAIAGFLSDGVGAGVGEFVADGFIF